jgi:hypothetical protein
MLYQDKSGNPAFACDVFIAQNVTAPSSCIQEERLHFAADFFPVVAANLILSSFSLSKQVAKPINIYHIG